MPTGLQKRRLREDFIDMYEYLLGKSGEDGARLYSAVSSDTIRGHENRLKYRKFHLRRRKKKTFLLVGW